MPSAAAGAVLEMNLLAQYRRMETPRVVLIAHAQTREKCVYNMIRTLDKSSEVSISMIHH